MTILTKAIPVLFKDNKLFFMSTDDIDSSNFEYFKPVTTEDGPEINDLIDYKIDFNKVNMKELKNSSSSLKRFIYNIRKNIGRIEFGIPLFLQSDNTYKRIRKNTRQYLNRLSDLRSEFAYDLQKEQNVENSFNIAERHNFSPRICFFPVGQGLSIGDDWRRIIFDAGGEVCFDNYSQALDNFFTSNHPTTLFISHWHWDHFSYVRKLLEKYGDLIVYTNDFYGGKKMKKLLRDFRGRIRLVSNNFIFKGYVFKSPNIPKPKDLNEVSSVLSDSINGILFTGDLPYTKIAALSNLTHSSAAILQVTHHGSGDKRTGMPNDLSGLAPKFDGADSVINFGISNRYGHPNADVVIQLTDIGFSIGKVTNDPSTIKIISY